MDSRTAAAMFNVPRSTLYAKIKSRIPIEGAKGPATYLTSEQENILVHWILYCSERGFPVMKCQLLQCVQKLVNELKRQTPFKDNKPGRHWFENFCRRHPKITQRVAQNLSASRASATEEVLRQWFLEVQQHLEKFGLLNIDPSRIFNLDESAFFLVPKADKVLARRGSKAVYKVVNGDEKESLTVLFTVSGNGVLLPPMRLFWYERIPFSVTSSLPRGWIAGSTERGWMTGESFYGYITTQFYPWLVKLLRPDIGLPNIQFPVVLFLDGHVSHLTLDLSQFCKAKQIELIALYPNATHVLPPLDVAVFHPLKAKWKSIVGEWRVENAGQRMRRKNFAPLLKKSVDSINNLLQIIIVGSDSIAEQFQTSRVKNRVRCGSRECSRTRAPARRKRERDFTSVGEPNECRKRTRFFQKPNIPTIINGFKTCGLSPFNANAVDFNILNKKSKTSAENTFEIENLSGNANNDQEEATKHLQFLENIIDADVLEDFQNAVLSGTWELSNSDNKGLFQYWQKTKRLSGLVIK
ncbi:LOW QUALITY PROTEIN: uncharacterized protein LOC143367200 [Andrena cerasifolii]|uniref:LOW QUALITY PROTEIN: uncharacterized protein LOC143367200 n=1 Tax=Andrena cerasifolii TaxID=2819439 RepID=UPI004037B64E